MWCSHRLQKFIQNLAELSEPSRPLLSKVNQKTQNRLDFNYKHTDAFNQTKGQIPKITENKHFDTDDDTRVQRDARKKVFGACLERIFENAWEPVAYANKFLNYLESRCSTNELELLAVIWSLERFQYYLYGSLSNSFSNRTTKHFNLR